MMTRTTMMLRPGLAALAAGLAFSSPLAAQQTAPVESAPAASAPVETTTPVADTPIVPDAPVPAADPLAPSTGEASPAATTRAEPTRPRATASRTVNRAAPAPARAAPQPVTTAVPSAEAPAPEPMPAPIAAPVEQAAPTPVPASEPTIAGVDPDEVAPVAGAGLLGLLAFAGLGFAMRRRRQRTEDDRSGAPQWQEPAMASAKPLTPPAANVSRPIVAPAMAGAVTAGSARSAFAWGDRPAAMPQRAESRIEAAYRGPTPDNPSHSLKKRLKRAAFFEQRERMVAAGKAEPVPADAGLPKALDTRMTRPAHAPTWTPALQPA